ncbi:MAG TPA: T9SS type A sorting domain-containing protein [Bacteroidia bacterium]|nr:T9SS type A sorting domain-containing protein [Bacteroidia bacterium]
MTTTYTLSAQGTGTNANCFSKKIVKITVKPKPTITLNTPNPVCQGNPIALFCTGNVISYTWIPGSLPHAPIVQYTPTTSGNQCVAVTGTNGCMSFTCVPVVVNPTPAILAFATPSVVCPGGVSYLYATGGNSYYWNAPINSSLNPLWVAPAVSTTYNVTGWGTNGCSRTETVAVLTLQAPTVTCQPPQICTGIQNTLTAFGASTYDWWVGAAPNTTFYPNTQSIFLTLTASTPYTVCGYGPNSCQACTSGVLNPGNPIPLSTTNVTLCTNSGLCTNISVASSFTAPINYSWAPAGILGSTINVCPAANTIYTVYANPSGTLGCPNSATLSVTLNSLCCPQATNGMVALNPAAGLGNLYANNSYVLSGPITLTASSTFSNAEVLMMPNAQITVPSGFQLNMEKAHMYACGNNMWNGIVVQDGGRIITSNSNLYTSMIEDAEIGIDLSGISVSNSSPLPPIEIQRVIFNRNYIGIRVANSDPGLDSLALGISGCVFTSRTLTFTSLPGLNWPSAEMTCGLPGVTALRCPTGPTTGLNSPYLALASFPAFQIASLKLPHNSEPGRAGIQIAKIGNPNGILSTPGVQIGITYPGIVAGDFNLFDGLGIGIDVLDAGLTTMNNVFQNMQNYLAAPNFTSFTGGQGIRHIVYNTTLMNARMYLTHTNTDDGNRFWNCPTAIQVNNVMDCWIRQGIFRSNHSVSTAQWPNAIPGDTGISINTNRFAFTVRESQFNNITHAVVFSTPTAACNYDIGAGIQPGICSREIVVERNYFGAQVTSTTPYSQGMANTSEYMYQAIKLQTPPSVNLNNWNYHPNSSPSFIISNKIDRSFRGVLVDGMMDNPIYVDANMMNIEDDYTFGPNSSTPNEGYGIEIRNNLDNMTIRSNTLTTANPWHNPLPSTPTIALVYCHLNYGSNASPRIECNSTQGSWYGFQFDDYNRSTVWEGNEMCTHWSGMALTNNGIIGTQGTPTQASGNVWKIAPGCQQIPAASNAYHTYCENSDPLNSFLYVTSTLDREPTFNNAAGFPGVWYTSGVSYDASVQQNRLSDCVGTFAYLPPPNWKITEVNNSTYLQSVNSNFLARIIPNPNMGIFELKFPTKIERAEIRMFDLCGRIQLETEFLNTDNTKIDISDLPNSIYLIEVTTNEHTFRAKVVKTY